MAERGRHEDIGFVLRNVKERQSAKVLDYTVDWAARKSLAVCNVSQNCPRLTQCRQSRVRLFSSLHQIARVNGDNFALCSGERRLISYEGAYR